MTSPELLRFVRTEDAADELRPLGHYRAQRPDVPSGWGGYDPLERIERGQMPTHEWTLAPDPYGRGRRPRNNKALIVAAIIMGVSGLIVVLRLLVPALSGEETPRLGSKSYNAQVDCQVNTVGGAGTVTISGTITGDTSRFKVTVEVLDATTRQRIGEQTFDVRDTTTFGGTMAAQVPAGPAGIECRIAKVA